MSQEPSDPSGADAVEPSAGPSENCLFDDFLLGDFLAPAPQSGGPRFREGDGFPFDESGLLSLDDLPGGASEADADERAAPAVPSYGRDLVESVWRFAETVPGVDPELWRRDEFGAWIHRPDYGRRASRFGWEIYDPGLGRHKQGVFAMRPMQWEAYIAQFEAFS